MILSVDLIKKWGQKERVHVDNWIVKVSFLNTGTLDFQNKLFLGFSKGYIMELQYSIASKHWLCDLI